MSPPGRPKGECRSAQHEVLQCMLRTTTKGGTAETCVGDVALEDDVLRLFREAQAQAHFGPVDALQHNVGIGPSQKFV